MARRTRDESTRAILDAAREILADEGHSGLSVRRIATAAGGSTMNVYSRFGGKDGILDALLIEGFAELCQTMQHLESSDDPVADLIRCSASYRQFALTNPTYYELMFDRTIPDYEVSDAAKVAAKEALTMLAERVGQAIVPHGLRPADPLETATIFWSACHGQVSLEMKQIGPPETDWPEVHARMVRSLVAGLS